jgi:hypothetical protein
MKTGVAVKLLDFIQEVGYLVRISMGLLTMLFQIFFGFP